MKRMLLLSIAALALPLAAQQTPAPAAAKPVPAPKQAAIVNGEVITVDRIDQMWNNMSVGFRDQYEASGGKQAFLENYLRKRLVIQEAIKSGFDKRPDVITDMDAARESALFDRYVRDIVAAPLVSDADIRKYYDEHSGEFAMPARIHVRHIVVAPFEAGPAAKTKEQALERIKAIAADLVTHNREVRTPQTDAAMRLRVIYFADAARKYSEDASASSGGDLGWKAKGELDPAFEEAAWHLEPGMMSGVIETQFGYHIIMLEERQAAGTEPFESVRPAVREYLLTQKATEVMTAVNKLTNELRVNSKITLFPENVK